MTCRPFSTPRRHRKSMAALMLFTIGVICSGSTALAGNLTSAVEQAINQSKIPRSKLSISIRDANSGREMVDIAGDKPRIPASNMKLLSTGASLDVFPIDHQFRTRLLLDGDRLIIVGQGDPALGDPDLLADMTDQNGTPLDIESLLQLWTDAIAKSGVTRIDELIIDDRIFDRDLLHASWPSNQVQRHYCAEVSGINFHRNIIALRPAPDSDRKRVTLGGSPAAPFLPLTNKLTVANGKSASKNNIDPHRLPLAEEIVIRGSVGKPQVSPVEVSIHDPAMFTARLIADRLGRRGIQVETVRFAEAQEQLENGTVLFDVVTPLHTVLLECNHESKNMYAEALLKHLGNRYTNRPGSWSNGSRALEEIVRRRTGVDKDGLIVSDGSGMSRLNRIPPSVMTLWLNSFSDDSPKSRAFRKSLPSPGSGTLQNRFGASDLNDCVVVAKSGYINKVSALSGMVIAPDGRCRTFSIMGNDLKRVRDCKRLQEKIVEAITADLASSTTGTAGPSR